MGEESEQETVRLTALMLQDEEELCLKADSYAQATRFVKSLKALGHRAKAARALQQQPDGKLSMVHFVDIKRGKAVYMLQYKAGHNEP